MPTARPALEAQGRETTGKAVSRMRRDGRLPGVVYGHGQPSTNVSIDAHEFELLRKHTTGNTLIDLTIDGGRKQPVLVHGVQVHPVNRRPLHVDLFLVRMSEEMTVDVPLVPVGTSRAITEMGGTLLHLAESVKIRALPDHLPESIEYSIESLEDFDATLHVRDLAIPSDVTLVSDPDEAIAKVQQPRVVEEEPTAEAVEGEAAEGADAAEGAEGAEGGAEGASGGESGGESGSGSEG